MISSFSFGSFGPWLPMLTACSKSRVHAGNQPWTGHKQVFCKKKCQLAKNKLFEVWSTKKRCQLIDFKLLFWFLRPLAPHVSPPVPKAGCMQETSLGRAINKFLQKKCQLAKVGPCFANTHKCIWTHPGVWTQDLRLVCASTVDQIFLISLSAIITPKGVPHLAKCNARATREVPSSKLKEQPPHRKIGVTSNLPVGRISVVTLIRTDTTLDHSQKAEKVCVPLLLLKVCNSSNNANGSDSGDASPPRGPGGPSRLSPRSNYFCAMCTTPPSGRLQGISV